MPPTEPVDLLIEARWVLPIAPVNTVLTDQAVAVSAGRIVAIGPREKLAAQFEPREVVVRGNHALLPGFVNAHTQAAMALLRGVPVYGPRARWIRETVSPLESRWMGPDFVRDGTQLAIAEMLRAGITTFADLYLYPEEAARAASLARVRAAIGLPVSDSATAWAADATEYLAKAEHLWDEYRSDPWVSLYFAPYTPYSASDDTLMRVRRVADELDARIAMHVFEPRIGETDSAAGGVPGAHDAQGAHGPHGAHAPQGAHGAHAPHGAHGARVALLRLRELGLLRPGFMALCSSRLGEQELEIAATTGISLVTCPQANLRLGGEVCAVTSLVEHGLCVGLGTDSPASVGALDMLAETRVAALSAAAQRTQSALDSVLPAAAQRTTPLESTSEVILRAATLGGAQALGLGSLIGSIEPGKAADLVCLDLAGLACQPPARIADAIVFAATRADVSDVWTAGRAAVSERRLLTFDEPKLLALAREWSIRTGALQE